MRGLLEVLILESVAREPKHGYALIQELELAFGATPNRNQVYPLLNRLEKAGYLRADRSGGRGKTRYSLTGEGVERLKAYRARPALFRQRVEQLWGPPPPGEAPPAEPPRASPPPAPLAMPPAGGDATQAGPLPREAAPAARGAGAHGGGPCTAQYALRKQPGRGSVTLELTDLDPSCPHCAAMSEALAEVLEQFL